MFTRLSNFTYDYLEIANIDETDKSISLAITIHIQKYEKECLRMILGDCLYADLMDQVELDESGYWKLKESANAKWEKLLNGTSYEASEVVSTCGCGCCGGNCSTHYWDGLVKTVAKVKDGTETIDIIETIMAPYIYMKWASKSRTSNFGVGEGKAVAANTVIANTSNKRADAWNEMVQNVAVGAMGGRVSLQQYLREHKQDFPEAVFYCFNVIPYWL